MSDYTICVLKENILNYLFFFKKAARGDKKMRFSGGSGEGLSAEGPGVSGRKRWENPSPLMTGVIWKTESRFLPFLDSKPVSSTYN